MIWFGSLGKDQGLILDYSFKKFCEDHPKARGVLLGGHGVINWADSDQECYEWTVEIIQKADAYLAKHDKGELTFGGNQYPGSDGRAA